MPVMPAIPVVPVPVPVPVSVPVPVPTQLPPCLLFCVYQSWRELGFVLMRLIFGSVCPTRRGTVCVGKESCNGPQ